MGLIVCFSIFLIIFSIKKIVWHYILLALFALLSIGFLYSILQARELMVCTALLNSKEMIVRINLILYLTGVLFTMEFSLNFSVSALP
jgi:hypothetical protein